MPCTASSSRRIPFASQIAKPVRIHKCSGFAGSIQASTHVHYARHNIYADIRRAWFQNSTLIARALQITSTRITGNKIQKQDKRRRAAQEIQSTLDAPASPPLICMLCAHMQTHKASDSPLNATPELSRE